MKSRKLGYTDLQLSTVGLGTWAIGGPWEYGWGQQDDKKAVEAILGALDEGINWIDTAPIYGCGHSEELVGQALKRSSHSPLIATKCGLLWNDKRQKISCLEPQSIIEECHRSLKRLDIDVIDLYQIHWPEPDSKIEFAFEAMAKLVSQGKVRYIGVSNFNVDQIARVQRIQPVASFQPPYSMLHREVEKELLDFCSENNIGVVVYSPMQRGLLTGKFNAQRLRSLDPDDHRLRHPDFQSPRFPAAMQLVEQLRPVADRNGITPAQLAISWVLRKESVTAAIVGARNPGQIQETAKASDVELSGEDIEQIEGYLREFENKIS